MTAGTGDGDGTVGITLDGEPVRVRTDRTLVEELAAHGCWVPTLCHAPGRVGPGTCRVCVVRVDGLVSAACTVRARDGMVVEAGADDLLLARRQVTALQFTEGLHNCPSCEKSGRCRLQSVAYETGMLVSEFDYRTPAREPEHGPRRLWLERDRCILCHRCVEEVADAATGLPVFTLSGRGSGTRIEVDVDLADRLDEAALDAAVELCPVGAILRKGVGHDVPIGLRRHEVRSIRDRDLDDAREGT